MDTRHSRMTVGTFVSLVLAAGCSHTNEFEAIKWRSIEPRRAGASVPKQRPERLNHMRFPEAVVHYPDDRVPADPSHGPYRSIGQLLIYYPDGTVGQSTAFLVGAAHILTTADGFVGPAGIRDFDLAVFTPALQGDRRPYGSGTIVNVAVPEVYVDACERHAYGMAIAVLDRPLGEQAGYLAYDFAAAAYEVTSARVTTAGYAADLGEATMVRTRGRIERDGYPGVWWHDLDAAPGQQGSPLWIDRDGEAVVVGIYLRGSRRHSCAVGPAFKPEAAVNALADWIRDNPATLSMEKPRSVGDASQGLSPPDRVSKIEL